MSSTARSVAVGLRVSFPNELRGGSPLTATSAIYVSSVLATSPSDGELLHIKGGSKPARAYFASALAMRRSSTASLLESYCRIGDC